MSLQRPTVPAVLVAALAACAPAAAADGDPGVSLGVLLDLRVAAAPRTTSWLDGGLGKVRYGGEGDERRFGFHVAQASFVLKAALSEALFAHVQVNLDPESYRTNGLSGVDVVEAYSAWRPSLSRSLSLRTKAGIFFPPVSMEHDGFAWSTTRTLTPSAVNSWVGEEVRATGLEASLVFLLPSSDLSLTGAVFGWNDPDGALLAWRGWSLSDRQSGYSDRLPLAALPEIGPGGVFPLQTPWTAPFREVDGHAGWYAGASWSKPEGPELRALWFDDGGDLTTISRGQYSWETRFASAGARLPFGPVELLAQGMDGWSRMGPGALIDVRFRAAYALASVRLGAHRLTARGDLFRVVDAHGAAAEYDERGWALTGAWIATVTKNLRVALEVVTVDSTRPGRYELDRPSRAIETLGQASLRLRF